MVALAIILFSLYFLLFFITKKLIRSLFISPIYIYIYFNLANILLSILYFYFYDNKFSIANVDYISTKEFWNVILLYLFANIAFFIGLFFYYEISFKKVKQLFNSDLNDYLFLKYRLSKKVFYVAVFCAFLIVILYLSSYGSKLISRSEYIPELKHKILVTFAKILSLFCSIILGLFYKSNKLLSSFLIFLITLFAFGTGSRTTFLILTLFFFMVFQSSKNTFKNKVRFLIQMSLCFVFLSFIVSIRQIPRHGLAPYFNVLFNGESKTLESLYFNIYYSLVFGVFATAKTLVRATPDWYHIYVSLNPLPGGIVGWPEVSEQLKITKFMPFTLHGQIFNMGYFFIFIFFSFVGFLFGFFEKNVRKFLIKKKKNSALFFSLLMALFIFYSFEYHLRSAFRYIYYALFALFIIWLIANIKKTFKKSLTSKSNEK